MREHARSHRSHIAQRSHLDAAVADPRKLLRDTNRFVDRVCLDQVEPREHFFQPGKRAVDDRGAAGSNANRFGRRRRLELLKTQQRAALVQLVGMRKTVAHVGVVLGLRQLAEQLFIGIDKQKELHRLMIGLARSICRCPRPGRAHGRQRSGRSA